MATCANMPPILFDLALRRVTACYMRPSIVQRCFLTQFMFCSATYRNDYHPTSTRNDNNRSYFTDILEPSEGIDGPPAKELPCTLILAEDFETLELGYVQTTRKKTNYAMRQQHSWHYSFSKSFPNVYGIPYTKWALSSDQTSFDVALSALKRDISSSGFQQPVLVTRGPVMSWLAQFYLESLPLSGLVMVDPLPFDKKIAVDLYKRYFKKLCKKDEEPSFEQKQLFSIVEDYINHWDHYTLKLEPGAIPMMILSSMLADSMLHDEEFNDQFYAAPLRREDEDDELHTSTFPTKDTSQMDLDDLHSWRYFSEYTAALHEGTSGEVPLVDVDPLNDHHCGTVVHEWISHKVV